MILQLIQHPLNTSQDFLNHSITAADNVVFKDVKTAVPLKYLSNFWRSSEMLLIKNHVELSWSKACVMSTIATTFK